uniref:Brix domain-containing protein n=1 Tax=Romanomermis culicivorax TaxID=13658 RepID=A0A915J1V4_ROMCU
MDVLPEFECNYLFGGQIVGGCLKCISYEIKLIFPNCQRLNRGGYELKQLVEACRANEVTDFILLHEHRGVPDGFIICHLPYGPTAYFSLSNVVTRHEIPDVGKMSEQYPHLIFNNLNSKLGKRLEISDVLSEFMENGSFLSYWKR